MFSLLFSIFFLSTNCALDTSSLPLLHLDDLKYVGAVRVTASNFDPIPTSMNYAEGPIEYDPSTNNLFLVGHSHHQNVAAFPLPEIVNSKVVTELNMAETPSQTFTSILDKVANPQALDRIGGLKVISGKLIVNAYEYYDAPADNTVSTLVFDSASEISTSAVNGYFSFDGGAGHTSGWMSPIPDYYQSELGGSMIVGQSSGIPIIGRCSVGPSAFAFTPSDVLSASDTSTPIPTVKLLDYSLENPIHADLSNDAGDNDLWTHLSRAIFGMIVPGTRTYFTVGYSGGHGPDGVCYKCVQQPSGVACGGYCTPDESDNYLYYWLFDVDDLVDVKNEEIDSFSVQPYEYGEFPGDFNTITLGGGSWDDVNNRLFLTYQFADRDQGEYSNPPIIAVYEFDVPDVVTGSGLKWRVQLFLIALILVILF